VQSTDDGEGERRAGWGNACDAIVKRLLIPAEGHSSDVAFSLPYSGGAYLSEAGLYGDNVHLADLSGADLSRANLSRADLHEASLRWANLSGADLYGVKLPQANLHEADLRGAKVSDEQLAQAKSLEGATLPDGTRHISEAEPTPAETEPQDAEGQPNQPGDLDAGGGGGGDA
jgi:hypothetical protein